MLELPDFVHITSECIDYLKKELTKLIEEYATDESKQFNILIYANYLKIKYNHHQYNLAIVMINNNYFWYLCPYLDSYLILKLTNNCHYQEIFNVIKNLNS